MKLKSTMKHRHLKKKVSLFLNIMAVVISYSLMIIQPYSAEILDNVHYDIIEGYQPYRYELYGTTQSSRYYIYADTKITVYLDGYYNGLFHLDIYDLTDPRNAIIDFKNCEIYDCDYTTYTSKLILVLQIRGTNNFEITVSNCKTGLGNINSVTHPNYAYVNSPSAGPDFNNFDKLTDSEIQTLLNIKNAIYDIKAYTDQIEPYILQCEGDLSSINSRLNDIYNRQNVINNSLSSINTTLTTIDTTSTNINNKLTSTNNKLDSLITAVNNIKTEPNQTEVNLVTNFNNDIDTITNIETNLMIDLDSPIINNKKGYEYIDNYIVNKRIHQDSVDTLNIYNNELTGPFGAHLYIFENISWYMIFVFVFALLGVIVG